MLIPVTIACELSDTDIRKKNFGQWFPDYSREWNNDWDFRHPKPEADIRIPTKPMKTLHLILVRHGQYDLKEKHLTPLGCKQAVLTGNRIREMTEPNAAIEDHYGRRKINLVKIVHSDVKRAVETANIVTKQLDLASTSIPIEVDPILAEGWPCLPNPIRDPDSVSQSVLYEESARLEAAFCKYCHRITDYKTEAPATPAPSEVKEDYMVLICHQNVIRYFVCRALQLPPEAWLRFRGSNCGITEIIITDDGRVSLEKFADVGHLPINHHTFH